MTSHATKESLISSRVLQSTAANMAGQVVTMGTGFVLTPFILHQIGPASYGLWVLVGSMVAYGTLLDLGMTSAVAKYVAEYRARMDADQAHKVVSTALTIYTLMGLVAIGVGLAIAPFFPTFFGVAEENRDTAIWVVILASVGVGISLPCSTAASVLRGLQRFDLMNVIGITGTLLVAVGTVVVLLLGYGVIGMVVVNIPALLITQLIGVTFVRRIAPELRFGWGGTDWRTARSIFSFSSSVSVQQLATRLQSKTDEIVIGAYMPIAAVTPYALALRLGTLTLILTRQFMKVLMPLASELHAEADLGRLRSLYITGTRLTLAIFLPIGMIVVLLAGPILTFWVGSEYAAYAYLVAILTAAGFVDAISQPAVPILQGMARHRLLAVTSIGTGVANLGLSVLLVRPFGLAGVAIGTLIPTAIGVSIVVPYITHVLGVSVTQLLKEVLAPTLGPAIPAAVVIYSVRELIGPSTAFSIVFVAGLGALVYGVGYLAFGASEFEKQTYKGFAQRAGQLVSARVRRAAES